VRPHTCISNRVYKPFALQDSNSDSEDQLTSADENTAPVAPVRRLRDPIVPRGGTGAGSFSLIGPPTPPPVLLPTTLQRSGSLSTIASLPGAIWKAEWSPPVGRYMGRVDPDNYPRCVYEIANDVEDLGETKFSGPNIKELASRLKTAIAHAVDCGDFSSFFGSEHLYYM
jgi:hypothetical protein